MEMGRIEKESNRSESYRNPAILKQAGDLFEGTSILMLKD